MRRARDDAGEAAPDGDGDAGAARPTRLPAAPRMLARRDLLRAALAAGATLLLPAAARRAAALAPARRHATTRAPALGVLLLATGPDADDVHDGATLGIEEAARAASLLGGSATLVVERGDADQGALVRRARAAGVAALVGGTDAGSAAALAGAAAALGAPFLHLGVDEALRGERCAAHVFHVAPGLAMQLDAALLWLDGRDDATSWRLALPAGATGEALRARVRTRAPALARTLLAAAGPCAPHLALEGLRTEGVPAARVVAWHHALERYGAAQVNDRFRARFARGMTSAAWAAWMAVKIAWEAASGPRAALPPAARLAGAGARYDGHKGRPLDFRAWDHQLRQPLYVVEDAGDGRAGAAAAPRLTSVPADGGDAPSRVTLDRIGTTREESACRLDARS